MSEESHKLTKPQRELLMPFVDRYLEFNRMIDGMSTDQLWQLRKACEACSQTNCGWQFYRVARIVMAMIAGRQHQLAALAKAPRTP